MTLVRILPAILNVMAVYALLLFIFSLLGMAFFGGMTLSQGPYGLLNEHANFNSFGMAMLTLFRMATGESWNGIMLDVQEVYPIAWVYFLLYQIICVHTMLNIVFGVILAEFCTHTSRDSARKAQKQAQEMITADDIDKYQEQWGAIARGGVQFIGTTQEECGANELTPLEDLLVSIGSPLGFDPMDEKPKSNQETEHTVQGYIGKVGIPHLQYGSVHYVECFLALLRHRYLKAGIEVDDIPLKDLYRMTTKLKDAFPGTQAYFRGIPIHMHVWVNAKDVDGCPYPTDKLAEIVIAVLRLQCAFRAMRARFHAKQRKEGSLSQPGVPPSALSLSRGVAADQNSKCSNSLVDEKHGVNNDTNGTHKAGNGQAKGCPPFTLDQQADNQIAPEK